MAASKAGSRFRSYFAGYSRQLWIISFGSLINNIGIQTILIFFAVYLTKLGASMTTVGVAMLVTILFYATSSLAGGILSDHLGRKRSILIGLGTCAAVLIAMGLMTSIFLLIGLHFLFSISLALIENAQSTMVADVTPPEKMAAAYGLIGSASMIGAGLGAIVGGFLATISYPLVFFVSALTSLTYFGLVVSSTTETLSSKAAKTSISLASALRGYASILMDKAFFSFCVLGLVFAIASSQSQTSFSIYATDALNISEPELGLLWLIGTWTMAFLMYPVSTRISKVRRPFYVLFGSTMLCAISFLIVYFSSSFPPLIAFIAVFTFSTIMYSPISSSLIANYATEKERGRRLGFYYSSLNIGAAIAPFVGGVLMDTFSGQHLWLITVAVSIFSGIGYLLLNRLTSRRFETLQPETAQKE